MKPKDKRAADDLVRDVLKKVRNGLIDREEGQDEIKATLKRFNYGSDVIEYALSEFRIHC